MNEMSNAQSMLLEDAIKTALENEIKVARMTIACTLFSVVAVVEFVLLMFLL